MPELPENDPNLVTFVERLRAIKGQGQGAITSLMSTDTHSPQRNLRDSEGLLNDTQNIPEELYDSLSEADSQPSLLSQPLPLQRPNATSSHSATLSTPSLVPTSSTTSWAPPAPLGNTATVHVQTISNLVIGIDFGTTFSGVAYCPTLNDTPSGGNHDAAKVAENIIVIKTWPNPNQQYLEKTPSIISYKSEPPTWGASVKPFDDTNVEHFKLGLESRAAQCYDGSDLIPAGGAWHPKYLSKYPVDFAADYLTCIQNFVQNDYLPRHYGIQFLRNQSMTYILTVPAIWSDGAKALTRQAAMRAGIPGADLILITEPEAAALFCVSTCVEANLDTGDRFLVCDAGGGTVVRNVFITI